MGKDYARKPSATILSNSSHLSDSMPAEPLPTTKIKKNKQENKKTRKTSLSLSSLYCCPRSCWTRRLLSTANINVHILHKLNKLLIVRTYFKDIYNIFINIPVRRARESHIDPFGETSQNCVVEVLWIIFLVKSCPKSVDHKTTSWNDKSFKNENQLFFLRRMIFVCPTNWIADYNLLDCKLPLMSVFSGSGKAFGKFMGDIKNLDIRH